MAVGRVTSLLRGRGLFGGRPATVTLRLEGGPLRLDGVPLADYAYVPSARTTAIAAKQAGKTRKIGTVEHLLAAFGGLGVHDGVAIELEGDELPILDGAAAGWCAALVELGAPRSAPPSRIARPGEVRVGASIYRFAPCSLREVAVALDYPEAHLELRAEWRGDPDDFVRRVAPARTFALAREIAALAEGGMMAHVDPESVVIVDEHTVHSAGVPAASDEPARHKLLDLVGDLVLHGGPPEGRIEAFRPGHAATHEIMARARAMGIVVDR
ncbi:UDP-3-O-acyl-N-acetylglucosamine deacetylase [Pendulispora rubella]|uniref:UDP-3-O-acyl-N-acetylglucosamine deacetylase n=1 Tax=Pendulispora rubella TaxID=2741070 RepID=A0ABZ2L8E5_9BACT